MQASERHTKLTVADFGTLVRKIRCAPRDQGVQRRYALFAVPDIGIVKIADNTRRFQDYLDQYGSYFVGVYDNHMRAGELEDDLNHAGVRLVEKA